MEHNMSSVLSIPGVELERSQLIIMFPGDFTDVCLHGLLELHLRYYLLFIQLNIRYRL